MKSVVRQVLKGFRKELRGLDAPMRSFERGLEILKPLVSPTTVIDVGVADGTPELYRLFPDNQYLLVEANPVFRPDLERLKSRLNAVVETVICGSEHGQQPFNMYSDPRKSSIYQAHRTMPLVEQALVPVERLDTLVAKHRLAGPYLLKIDVEGAELEVLIGAAGLLAETEAVIAESSIMPRHQGAPEFADLVGWLAQHGFSVFDLTSGVNHPHSGFLHQVDIIFVKTAAPFRVPP